METPATRALRAAGVAYSVHTFEAADRSRDGQGSRDGRRLSFGAEAAEAIGVDRAGVFKTLLAEVDGRLWVARVPVGGMLDLKALAAVAGGKRAGLAEPTVAERSTGYVVGGISPLGQRRPLPTVLDASAAALPTIYVSGGRRGPTRRCSCASTCRWCARSPGTCMAASPVRWRSRIWCRTR